MNSEERLSAAYEVIETIERAGGEAYVVGGAVRDLVIGQAIGDIDIATSMRPESIQEIFEKVIPIGIEHGTVMVRHKSQSYEVTTYRTEEGYEDFRHPDKVTFVKDIKKDLARRDFTMNAMAMDRFQSIVDPFDGRSDLAEKLIKAVGNPSERFEEDPLRMMRAARFASQLNFKIDVHTNKAMKKHASLLKHISIERTAVELQKLFNGKGYHHGISVLDQTGLVKELPVLSEQPDIHSCIPAVQLTTWPELIAFFVCKGVGTNVADWVSGWKLSNRIKNESSVLLNCLQIFQEQGKVTEWLVYQLPPDLHIPLARVIQALYGKDEDPVNTMASYYSKLVITSENELAFQARDLIRLYSEQPKGPWIAETMNRIERMVVEEKLENNFEKIKEWVKWNPPASSS